MRKYFSWLECILIFAVLLMLIVLAVRYFTVIDLNTRVAQAISKIDIVSRASHNWLLEEHRVNFSGITMPILIDAKRLAKTDAINPWGGQMSVSAAQDTSHVRIELSVVPRSACERLRQNLKAIAFSQATSEACMAGHYYGEF